MVPFYCKNVILPENVACSYLLRDIEHADISRYLDTGRSDYRNEGHCIRFHSNGKEIALYDKVKDYLQGLKSEKRAIDNDAAFQNIPVKELAKMLGGEIGFEDTEGGGATFFLRLPIK